MREVEVHATASQVKGQRPGVVVAVTLHDPQRSTQRLQFREGVGFAHVAQMPDFIGRREPGSEANRQQVVGVRDDSDGHRSGGRRGNKQDANPARSNSGEPENPFRLTLAELQAVGQRRRQPAGIVTGTKADHVINNAARRFHSAVLALILVSSRALSAQKGAPKSSATQPR